MTLLRILRINCYCSSREELQNSNVLHHCLYSKVMQVYRKMEPCACCQYRKILVKCASECASKKIKLPLNLT